MRLLRERSSENKRGKRTETRVGISPLIDDSGRGDELHETLMERSCK